MGFMGFFTVLFFVSVRSCHTQEPRAVRSGLKDGASCFVSLGDSGDTLTVAAVGDIMMGGRALPVLRERGFHYPFDSTRHVILDADIAVGNLEAPFALSGKAFEKKFTFMVPPSFAEGLAAAGFDVLTLANNHILDFGPEALQSTLDVLDSLGLAHCGAGKNRSEAEKPALVEIGGKDLSRMPEEGEKGRNAVFPQPERRAAFLAYSLTYPEEFWAGQNRPGTSTAVLNRMEERIRSLRDSADFIIVSFHWGGELMESPKAYQRDFGRKAIDAGADLVLGHHPHVIQGIEWYRGRLIAYSLGNFVFGSLSGKVQNAIILRVTFNRDGVSSAEVLPVSVDNREVLYQPRLLSGSRKAAVLEHLSRISVPLNDGELTITPDGILLPPCSPPSHHTPD